MFRKGTFKFNQDANFNFQLNRVVMWGNGDPKEIAGVAKSISDSKSWVKAILDHNRIDDVTIIGASLGGYLAPRAAAFEKRITKVIGWSIFPDFFDILLADDPKALRVVMDSMYRHGRAGIFNKLYKK